MNVYGCYADAIFGSVSEVRLLVIREFVEELAYRRITAEQFDARMSEVVPDFGEWIPLAEMIRFPEFMTGSYVALVERSWDIRIFSIYGRHFNPRVDRYLASVDILEAVIGRARVSGYRIPLGGNDSDEHLNYLFDLNPVECSGSEHHVPKRMLAGHYVFDSLFDEMNQIAV